MPTPIDPNRIRTDLDTQSRIALNEDVVKEYADAMEAGAEFPAPIVFYDEQDDLHILAEGFHRLAAHMKVKPNDPILVELRLGTVEDARWVSIGANKSHGLRRTNEDKRNAVTQALVHPKGVDMSNVKIGEHVGVSHTTVQNVRKELEATCKICKSETRTGQDGRTINTGNIGFGKTAPPPGSTCATCRYFEKSKCYQHGTNPVPWTAACEDFAVKVDDPPRRHAPPPDYNRIVFSDTEKRKAETSKPHQYRRLKDCQTVHLPRDNPDLFAIELRNTFPTEYLTACIARLRYFLTESDD